MEQEKKHSCINDYILLQTLGEGLNSKVKLAQDKRDGKMYAVKIINENSSQESNVKAIVNESKILQQMDHPNIVHVYELRDDGNYTKPDGTSKKVLFAVLQLAQGGEVFDFLSSTGRFSEAVSRFYFRQLIEALDHCHSRGFAHRDLKPENLLFDDQFNLLLADFGFATLMAGKDGSGKLRTILGTDNYMAPEIHSKAPYIGSSVDLFAAGIILFIFFTGHPPFNHAKATDSYYSLICMNNHEKFWNYHARKKPNGLAFFSKEFMNLINAMLAFDPTQRPSIAEIKAHPWYRAEVPTHEEVKAEFAARKAKVEEQLEAKKRQIEAQRQARPNTANVAFTGINAQFRDITVVKEGAGENIILDDSQKVLEQVKSIKLERQPPVYREQGSKCMTNYYSALAPEELLKCLVILSNKLFKNVILHADKFKVCAKKPGKDETVVLDMTVYVNDYSSIIQFNKLEGSLFEYQKAIKEIKDDLDALEKDVLGGPTAGL